MAQSVPGESPPGGGGGGIPISNTNVALWDQQIHTNTPGWGLKKKRRSVQILHPVDKVDMYFSQV